MNEYPKLIRAYFKAHENYFWKWNNQKEYIELFDNSTIALRKELEDLLKQVAPEGLIRLGPMLLTLLACQEESKQERFEQLAFHLKSQYFNIPIDEKRQATMVERLERYVEANIRMMQVIRQLPARYRTGEAKVVLIKTLFESVFRLMDADIALPMVDEFRSGNYDAHIEVAEPLTHPWMQSDLDGLRAAYLRFPDVKTLEMAVRTGITELPETPEIKEPQLEEEDLLEALSSDAHTEGLVRLTNRIIAALHIPAHTHGSSDQSYGGVSDITNRGNFDRLLLSELAQDNDVLTARLVNNEALYLRREEPPVKRERQRVLLLDTTIRMWGIPKIFAVSSAIACSYKVKNVSEISFYALQEETACEIELHTRRGVMEALELLDAGLDSSVALKRCLETQTFRDNTDVIYICEESFLKTTVYTQMMSESKTLPGFILTVNRTGALVFYQVTGRRLKIISSSLFNLQELLFVPKKNRLPKKPANTNIPVFYDEPPVLYFPSSGMRLSPQQCCWVAGKGLFGVTETNRLMFWSSQHEGATELHSYLGAGNLTFGYVEDFFYVLSCNGDTPARLFRIDAQGNCDVMELSGATKILDSGFDEGKFYLSGNRKFVVHTDGSIDEKTNQNFESHRIKHYREKQRQQNFKSFKRLINNGYTTIQRVGSVKISERNTLMIDNRELTYDTGFIKFADQVLIPYTKVTDGISRIRIPSVPNPAVNLSCFGFDNGSKVCVDSRGLIHLISHDDRIPQITLVLVVGKSTAAWASDGIFSGSDYFIPEAHRKSMMEPLTFYNHYIAPFITKALS